MSKKKSTSIFLEPYNLLQVLGQGIALIWSTLVQTAKDARQESQKDDPSNEVGKEAYTAVDNEFKNPEFKKSWKTFLYRSLAIQAFLLVLTLTHLAFGNLWLGLQLSLVFAGSIIFFGYKPWIRRNKRVVSFMTYLRKGVKADPQALMLWLSLKECDGIRN